MNDHIRLFAKVSSRTAMAWVKIAVPGGILTFTSIIVVIILMAANKEPGFSGTSHSGGMSNIPGVLVLFAKDFWTALLLFGLIGCAVFYIAVANKYALHTTLSQLWQQKLSGTVLEKANYYIEELTQRQPGWMKSAGGAAKVKLRLLQAMKEDKTMGTLQRKALGYVLKRAALEDTDFSQNDTTIARVLTQKLSAKLYNITQPTMKPFWIAAGLQLIVLILAVVFNHQ